MKYQTPKLYRIFPLNTAGAACVNGDNASNPPSCAAGPDASGGCASGAAASSRCAPGAAAGSKCAAGTGHG